MEQQDQMVLAPAFVYEAGRLERKLLPAVEVGRAIARSVCETEPDRSLVPYQLGNLASVEAERHVQDQPVDVKSAVVGAAREEAMFLGRTRRKDDVKVDDLAARATFRILAEGRHVPLHDAHAAAKALDAAWMKALGPPPSLKGWDPTDPFGADKAWLAELKARPGKAEDR